MDPAGYRAGERIGRYEVLRLLGRGGMAAVYAVRQRGVGSFERTLALKLMLPHLVEDEDYLNMFLDEIRIVSRIEHPNVVQVIDVGEHEGIPFMVMELIAGKTLRECIKAEPPFPILAAWLAQVAAGLHAAHETRDRDGTWLQIVHRDVSSANILVGSDGCARLLDFGIAAAVGRATMTRHGELKGRFSMMAPEMITRAVAIDRRADVWSLGVLAWQACATKTLFRGDNEGETLWRVINAPVPELPSSVPAAIRTAIDGALQRDVSKRISTTEELGRPFEAYATQHRVDGEVLEGWVQSTFGEVGFETPAEDDVDPVSMVSIDTLDSIIGKRSRTKRSLVVGVALALVTGIAVVAASATEGESAPTELTSQAESESSEESALVAPETETEAETEAEAEAALDSGAEPDAAARVASPVRRPRMRPGMRTRRAEMDPDTMIPDPLLDSPYR